MSAGDGSGNKTANLSGTSMADKEDTGVNDVRCSNMDFNMTWFVRMLCDVLHLLSFSFVSVGI